MASNTEFIAPVDITAEKVTRSIFTLFRKHGCSSYIGEAVTQQEHAIQCAMLARKQGYSEEVILGAFLHDIGHMVGIDQGFERMVTGDIVLGSADHEKVGEQFLKELGFPESVTSIVRGHVTAKRYLVFKYQDYYNRLSEASKMTLVHQGGPMSKSEAEEFEKQPQFKAILKMREWDEAAKDTSMKMDSLPFYEEMCQRVLEKHIQL
ncbi:2-amino-1-hydroxyethylphosphonate dioxygenase (glycine-forming)-like [Ptychodera flava]|uniref:2-amino-1-hydroxyethylphosphonate dioxygenase (glycine-forming)-like n=1 Tax=Ptychodera flava TaxID=63121 RepID=UPI003969E2E9